MKQLLKEIHQVSMNPLATHRRCRLTGCWQRRGRVLRLSLRSVSDKADCFVGHSAERVSFVSV